MLATQTDVEQRIQVDFGNDTEPVIVTLLAAAQGQYERLAGRPLESDSYVETYDPPNGTALWLRHTPVTAITSVTEDGTVLTVADDYYFNPFGRVQRVSAGLPSLWRSRTLQSIIVDYEAGFDDTHFLWDSMNDDVAWMVAAAFQRGTVAATDAGFLEGVESEQIGTHILRYMSSVGDSSKWIAMTDEQRGRARALAKLVVG